MSKPIKTLSPFGQRVFTRLCHTGKRNVLFVADQQWADVVNDMTNGRRRFNWPDVAAAQRACVEAAIEAGYDYAVEMLQRKEE